MKTIGKYEIRGLLGRGGMGRVYKVQVPVIGKIAALKRLEPHPHLVSLLGETGVRDRFIAESATLAGIRHPHVVGIHDYDTDEAGRPFYLMGYWFNNLGVMMGETYRTEAPSRILPLDRAFYYPANPVGACLSPPFRGHPPGHQALQHPPDRIRFGEDLRFRPFEGSGRNL